MRKSHHARHTSNPVEAPAEEGAESIESDFEPEGRFERRRKKKENAELASELVEHLLLLKPQDLEKAPIEDGELLDALKDAQRMKADNARKRQCRYLSSLLLSEDLEAINAFLSEGQKHHQADVDREHELEQWREKILSEGEAALEAFVKKYPSAESASLKSLAEKAQREMALNQNKTSYRALLKALRKAAVAACDDAESDSNA